MDSDSSSLGNYSDGVYDKVEAQSQYAYSPAPLEKPPKLPTVTLACLILLLLFCCIGILLSGLHFGNKAPSGDCLGQSWVMFASLLGLLYIILHLQAARKGEPVNRQQPCSQNPLHSSCIVIARLDAVAWAVALIIVSVAVSKDAAPVSCGNLVACTAVTPAIFFILCVDEKATRPFDLPYLTNPSSSSIITCRVSALMLPSTEDISIGDSISRRGSGHSSSSSTSSSRRSNRPNSHTQHAAAIAAANSTTGVGGGGLSGPRPPPKSNSNSSSNNSATSSFSSASKEASAAAAPPPSRTGWGFQCFDGRTKQDLAASVAEASRVSDARARVGGPRALALSDRAVQMGVLPPPVCLEPKFAREQPQPQPPPQQQQQQQTESTIVREVAAAAAATTIERTPSKGSGGWRSEWGNLAADTGYNSTSTTPASTPGIGPAVSLRTANRCLSPVAEVDDRRSSVGGGGGGGGPQDDIQRQTARVLGTASQLPPPSSTTATTTSSWGRGRWASAPRSQPTSSSSSYTYGTRAIPGHQNQYQQQQQQQQQPPTNHYTYTSASIPRPPPPVATAPRAASPARMRLMRAQEALKVRGGRDTVVLLNRPQRLTGDGRRTQPGGHHQQQQRPPTTTSAVPDSSRARPELFRMPGSFENEWETPTRA